MPTKIRARIAAKKQRGRVPAKKALAAVTLVHPQDGEQAALVRTLRERFGVSRKTFSRLVGFSERAIADWEARKPLSEPGLQRMREMSRLQQALAGIMREDFVGTWLASPNEAFDGLKPIEVVERGEIDRLWRMIYELQSGTPT
jgi:DNA-binding transcriptional regulator YiaG